MDYKSSKLCNVVKQLLNPESGLNLNPTPTTLSDWKQIIQKEVTGWVIIHVGAETKKFFEEYNYGIIIPSCKPYNLMSDKKSLNSIHKLYNNFIRRKNIIYDYLLVVNYNTFFDIIDNYILPNKDSYKLINFVRNKYVPNTFWMYIGIHNSRYEYFKNINKGELIVNNNFIRYHNTKKIHDKVNWKTISENKEKENEEEEKENEEEEEENEELPDIKYSYSYKNEYSRNLYRLVINEKSIINMIIKVCNIQNISKNTNIFDYLNNLEEDVSYVFEKLIL